MAILWRHYGLQYLRAFLVSLVILALIVLVVDTLLNINDLAEGRDSAWGVIQLLLLRAGSQYLAYLIPVAAFTGTFAAVSGAARAHEVVALKAGGISPLRAFAPVLVLSVGIAVLTFAANETLGVRAAGVLASRAGFTSDEVTLRSGTVWVHAGPVIYSARDLDPNSAWLRDVQVFERDASGRLRRVVHAWAARRLSAERWEFEKATIRDFDPGNPTAPPHMRYVKRAEIAVASPRGLRLDPRELAALPLGTLVDYVMAVLDAGGNPGPAQAILHARLTVPFIVLLFAFLALPLALSVEQSRSLAVASLQGVTLLFLFVFAREYGQGLVVHARTASAWVPWAVLLVFFAYGGVRMVRVPR